MNDSPSDRLRDNQPDDILELAIAEICRSPADGPPPELVNATLEALHKPNPLNIPFLPPISRSLLMKSLSAAAGLLLIAGAATIIMTTLPSSSHAFADAVEQLRSVRTLSYTKLIMVEGRRDAIKTREFYAEDGRHRSEQQEAGVTSIFDDSSRIRLTLIHATKTALVSPAIGDAKERPKHRFLEWLDRLKQHGDEPSEKLGEKMLDGRRAIGFVAKQANTAYTIWIDMKSNEIVRIEYDPPYEGPIQRVIMTDFQFNETLDDSLFSVEAPAGYTVKKQPPAISVPGGEESIVEALRGFTRLTDGKFPGSISDWGEWAVAFSKHNDNGLPTAETTRTLSHLGSILPFLTAMKKDDYQYLGKGKTTDDAEAVIFWYKKKDGAYRAIYGDLTVKAIAADDLPPE